MPSRLFDQNHLPHSILKHTKSVIDSQYIMTTGLCEDHKYLGDKYQIPATEPQVSSIIHMEASDATFVCRAAFKTGRPLSNWRIH